MIVLAFDFEFVFDVGFEVDFVFDVEFDCDSVFDIDFDFDSVFDFNYVLFILVIDAIDDWRKSDLFEFYCFTILLILCNEEC